MKFVSFLTKHLLTKLAKRLSTFNYEDFLIMSNEDEEIVKPFLEKLISEGRIKSASKNSYTFVDIDLQNESSSSKKNYKTNNF